MFCEVLCVLFESVKDLFVLYGVINMMVIDYNGFDMCVCVMV